MRLSKPRVKIIDELLKPDHLLLNRDSSFLSNRRREEYLCGTCVITLDGDKETLVSRHSWQPAKALLEAGLIEFVEEKYPHGRIYRITAKATAVKEPPKQRAVREKVKRPLLMDEIKAIAVEHGCELRFSKMHKWYELKRFDGKKLSNPYIAYNKKGKPVMKQSDLSRDEWIEAIRQQSEPVQELEQTCEQQAEPEQEQDGSSTLS